MGPKFTPEQFILFCNFYFNNRNDKEYKWLRFGQAFFYYFRDQGMNKVTDAELFYEPDPNKATDIIYKRYIQF